MPANNTKNQQDLTKYVQNLDPRSGERPQTRGPAPHQQLNDWPTSEEYSDSLFEDVMKLKGVVNGESHIGDGGLRAFFIENETSSKGFGNPHFLIDNEFAHIHRHGSLSLHLALPISIGKILEEKGWTENHPLAKANRIPSTNYMLYGARDQAELEVSKNILHISYLWASNNWQENQ